MKSIVIRGHVYVDEFLSCCHLGPKREIEERKDKSISKFSNSLLLVEKNNLKTTRDEEKKVVE